MSKLTAEYVSSEESEKYVNEILSTPSGAKEKLRFLLMASKTSSERFLDTENPVRERREL
jgi:hypothetical protein